MSQVSGQRPLVSFIIATHNRVDTLLHTLERVEACGLGRGEYETIVVDNASTDGTPDRLRRSKPDVHLLALDRNRGSCAKSLALPHARGEYVVFLDDDSYPLDESVRNMIRRFEDDPALGAAGFVVQLPDGGQESSALPNVFIGCGVGFRREVLIRVGGLDLSYFMQAEEYDLSFRLAGAGYSVQTFGDLHVMHLKDIAARSRDRTGYLDLRNNLMLAATYLPSPWHREFIRDWVQRYRWLSGNTRVGRAHLAGRASGLLRGYFRRLTRPGSRLDHQAMDNMFGIGLITTATAQLAKQGCSRVLFAGLGKNIYPYYRAARRAGVEVLAVMDDRFAHPKRRYRGVPLVTDQHGLMLPAEAIIVSNSSPVHARATEARLRSRTDLPIHRWHGRFEFEDEEIDSGPVQLPRYQAARSGAP